MTQPATLVRVVWIVMRRSSTRGSVGTFAMERTPRGVIVPTFWTRAEARAFARKIRIPGFTATPRRSRSTLEAI